MIMVRSTKNASFAGYCDGTSQILHLLVQSRTQASSRYPSYQRRLGTECDSASPRWTFPTNFTGDVTSEIAEEDWERGCFWWMKSGMTPHGTVVGQLYIFIFLFFNKCPFKHANVELQPALALSRPAPGILDNFLCRVNVFLFSIVLSFYWVLIVSGRLEGRLDFLPTVYWKTVLVTELNF